MTAIRSRDETAGELRTYGWLIALALVEKMDTDTDSTRVERVRAFVSGALPDGQWPALLTAQTQAAQQHEALAAAFAGLAVQPGE